MAVLCRPIAVLVFVLAALALPATALSDGRDILVDFQDNGQIDECYTPEEFRQALTLVRNDQRQYGGAAEVLQQARITNVDVPGEPCGAQVSGEEIAAEDGGGGGSNVGLWIAHVAAVLVAGGGAAYWARRGGGGADEG
jgi:hypothetical protein